MADFWRDLVDPDVTFLRYALLLGLVASVAFGMVGTVVVARRISALAGAIAHAVLGGIGAALYAKHALGWTAVEPLHGALVAALLAAGLLHLASRRGAGKEDTVLSVIWSTGMAIGLLFLAKTPAYVDPMSYLFGNIALVTQGDLLLVLVLDAVIAGVVLLRYNRIYAMCCDEEFARLRDVPTGRYNLLLLTLTALTVVLLVTVVGIILVIALLTLPAATAGRFSHRLGTMMVGAVALCAISVASGLVISYPLDLPAGPVIILVAASLWGLAHLIPRRS